ncbi:MAG: hypothetical protein ACEPOV_03015 [Hyphomicrobiales bacterium]
MKLKLRHKSFISSLKKLVLRIKEKAVLCVKQSSSTTQTYNELTVECTQETKATCASFSNFIDAMISISAKHIQKKRNVTTKCIIRRTIENKTIVFNFKAHLKHKIIGHPIYYEKLLLL